MNTQYQHTTQLGLELKDNANPVRSQPYPVPRVHKAMFGNKFK